MSTVQSRPYRMPEMQVGEHAEIQTENIRSMQTMLGKEARERGWEITTRATETGLRVHRIK